MSIAEKTKFYYQDFISLFGENDYDDENDCINDYDDDENDCIHTLIKPEEVPRMRLGISLAFSFADYLKEISETEIANHFSRLRNKGVQHTFSLLR